MTAEQLTELLWATWPAASESACGPVTLRRGEGGGSRVSAASAPNTLSLDDLRQAEIEMQELGQVPQFRVLPDQDTLDGLLAATGYQSHDPTLLFTGPLAPLAEAPLERMSTFEVFPPLGIQREIWAQGGIGPARLAIMDRARGPKTSVLGRHSDRPVGAGFGAVHQGTLMVHALEVLPEWRRQGAARQMIQALARFGQDNGAEQIALLVTQANTSAVALYHKLGLQAEPGYHYRRKDAPDER